MKTRVPTLIGGLVVLVGMLVIGFSCNIVFPGLVNVVGPKIMFGKGNLVYNADGSYYFNNPLPLIGWVAVVEFVGIAICTLGFWLSQMAVRFRNRKPAGGLA
jgi:hypothetical protein